MSDNKIQNEEELWSVLDGTAPAAPAEPKAESKPAKTEGKFSKPGAPKGKVDSFFLTCMAGVAAVSVAVTLLVTSLVGGEPSKPVPGATDPNPGISGEIDPGIEPGIAGDNEVVSALELENAELRAQVELQKDQIKKLQAELLDLSAGSEEMPTLPEDADSEMANEQLKAYEIFNQIKDAYADFDRAKLEELVPEMDKRLTYLGKEALNEYYMILEYVEMPSNG